MSLDGGLNELTSSHGIRVSGSITASHNIRLGNNDAVNSELTFGASVADFAGGATAISKYQPAGLALPGGGTSVPSLFTRTRGSIVLQFISIQLLIWRHKVPHI